MTSMSHGATPLNRQTLGEAYVLALEAYLACPEESALSGAYELGRKALLDGLTPLDLVSLLHNRGYGSTEFRGIFTGHTLLETRRGDAALYRAEGGSFGQP